jgi:hypothetical protein
MCWRAEVEGRPRRQCDFFSVLEAFSFLLNDGKWLSGQPTNNEDPQHPKNQENSQMKEKETAAEKIYEEFAAFGRTMEELYLLKRVASDLRHYRRMIKLKKYD